jgi:hypothetical protein
VLARDYPTLGATSSAPMVSIGALLSMNPARSQTNTNAGSPSTANLDMTGQGEPRS